MFANHVKTSERINMGFRPLDAKSSVDGHRLHLCVFRIIFPILLLINFQPNIFPPMKTKDTHIAVVKETHVELVLIHFLYL